MMYVDPRSGGLDLLSICTGGGGLDLGVGLAVPSARSVCMVEREAFACAHLVAAMRQGLLHEAPVWTDARTFDGRRWRGCVDGLIGGIPCQPHSLAGRKGGQHDERDLWSTARRIIVQARPWLVLIENVGGMLSAGKDKVAGAERVWRDLRRLGFTVEGGLFTAEEAGAPHKRERLFILGIHDGLADSDQSRLEGHGLSGKRAGKWPSGPGGRELADAFGDGFERGEESHLGSLEPAFEAPRRGDAERCDRDEVDAARVGRGKGRAEPVVRCGRNSPAGAGEPVGDANEFAQCEPNNTDSAEPRAGPWARVGGSGGGFLPIFPPGPGDIDAWRAVLAAAPQLEPALRGVADGLAGGVGSRVDELRLLGNGVFPLVGGYAVRTLGHALARAGSSGAARLVRMMEASS